jgi:HAD superfamily hydrolase (TIGR01662 family)
LNHAGFRVVIATNQSGIGRGLFDMATLNAIHEKMHRALALVGGRIDALFYCPHTSESQCDCRKPKTGMLQEIGMRLGVDLTGVPSIGDSCARPAGCGGGRRAAHPGAHRQAAKDSCARQLSKGHGDLSDLASRRRRCSRASECLSAAPLASFALFELIVTPFYAIAVLALFWLPPKPR